MTVTIPRLVAGLLILSASAPLFSQEGEGDAPFTVAGLTKALEEYDESVRTASRAIGKCRELDFTVRFFGNAWEHDVIERLRAGLARSEQPEIIIEDIRTSAKKERRKLEKKAAMRIELTRPGGSRGGGKGTIDYLPARNPLEILMPGKKWSWKIWKADGLETIPALRIAQGYRRKAKSSSRTPDVRTEKGARIVFQGGSAHLYGLFAPKLLDKKKGKIVVRLHTSQYQGVLSGVDEIDLNRRSNQWHPDLVGTTEMELPFEIPDLPAELARFVTTIHNTATIR